MESVYTPAQISQWEEYVSLPTKFRQASKPALNVAYLTALHIHEISSVPYENLTLHYSATRKVSLDPQDLFQKIVADGRGRGGYCMECSIFFYHVLKALGFTVYLAGVRIRPRNGGVPEGNYTGWVHIVNIVTLPTGDKYVLDVGFGGDQMTRPMPLLANRPQPNLGTQEIRLIHGFIPEQTHRVPEQKLWIYQYRNSPTQEWNSFYAFPETEFFAPDFNIINHFTSTYFGGTNFQTVTVLCVRFLRGKTKEGGEEEIVGKVMLFQDEVKRNDGGKTKMVMVCKTEEERVGALKEHFRVTLLEEEVKGVKGRSVELLGVWT